MNEISRTVSTALQSMRQREQASRLAGKISETAQEMTTGMKARPYDALGHRSSDAIAIRMQIVRNDGFLTSNSLLERRFESVEIALSGIREAGQDVLNQLLVTGSSAGLSSDHLAQSARAAIDFIVGRSAVSDSSGFVMSGTRSDARPLQSWDVPNAETGLAPAQILDNVLGGTIGGLADAYARIDALKRVFDDADTTNPDYNFDASFYNGSPALDAAGGPNPLVKFRISENETLTQPAQANDPAMRDLLRGLAMISSVDVNQITDLEARDAWMGEARSAISKGLGGLANLETTMGIRRAQLADTIKSQESRSAFLNTERLALEGVDQYDAASRLTLLQTQLESSYAVTARLSRMSFLNYL